MGCGREITDDTKEYCVRCETRRPSVTRNFAVWQYDRAMKKSIAAFKYDGRREYADFYVRHMAQCFGRQLLRYGVTAFVPIPVSPERRRYRGFNQAELISEGLAERTGLVSLRLLTRVKNTLPQSGLAPGERQRNLSGSIAWNRKEADALKELPAAVAVVDDIYTTGSTMSACAEILKENGIPNVYGVCICIGSE